MQKKNSLLILGILLSFIFMISFVSAVPPQQTSTTTLELESAYPSVHKLGEDYYVHTHIYDTADEVLVTTNVDCYYHFYNHQLDGGQHIQVGTMTRYGMGYNATINGSLINESGEYSALIWCNTSSPSAKIGYNKYTFEVSPTGKDFSEPESNAYLIVTLALILFLLLTGYGALKLPYKNPRNEDDNIIGINDLKYLKIVLFAISYGILTWLANLMIVLSNNYIDLGIALKFFEVLFRVMIALVRPIMFIVVIVIAINAVRDWEKSKELRDIFG